MTKIWFTIINFCTIQKIIGKKPLFFLLIDFLVIDYTNYSLFTKKTVYKFSNSINTVTSTKKTRKI